jgi:hypothetical protein
MMQEYYDTRLETKYFHKDGVEQDGTVAIIFYIYI